MTKVHSIVNKDCEGVVYSVDEGTSLSDIEQAEPKFFATKFGEREAYEMYKGCLIVRYTAKLSGGGRVRKTVVYLFDTSDNHTFCVSAGAQLRSAAQAKAFIDRLLATGSYWYGMGK
jgi:hypothetical protein